jgi:hypothetical protein
MLKNIKEFFRKDWEEETLQQRWPRIKYGIIIGVVGALFYAVIAATINIISYPELHLTLNWSSAITTWVIVSLAMVRAGFIVGWPTEEVKAIVGGGVTLTFLLLLVNTIMFISQNVTNQSYFQVLVASLPMVGVIVLMALALRQGINKAAAAEKEESRPAKRNALAKIFSIVILLGIIGGLFSRFDGSAVTMLKSLNERLQTADASGASMVKFPSNVLDDVQSRYGQEFGLYIRSAAGTIGALDVTISFADGYTVTCQIPTTSGSYVFIDACSEGNRVK